MWALSADAVQALGGAHSIECIASVSLDGQTLVERLPIEGATLVEEWSGRSVSAELTLPVVDDTGTLLTSSPTSPLAPFGQRITLTGLIKVGSLVLDQVPMGRYLITDPEPTADEEWHRYSNGAWVPLARQYSVKAVDLLDLVADDPLLSDYAASGTTYADSVALLDGLMPMGPWVTTRSSPLGATWTDDRMDALMSLADLEGCVSAVSRVGTYLPRSAARKSTPDWTLVTSGQGATLGRFRRTPSVAGLRQAVVVTGTAGDESAQMPTRGVDYIRSGPLRWGGPMGKRGLKATNPLATSDATAQAMATTQLANLVARLTVPVTFECADHLGLECLDTVAVPLPDKTLTGIVSRIERSLDGSADARVTASVPWTEVWSG